METPSETLDGALLDCAAVLARLQKAEEAERFEAAERGEVVQSKVNLWDPWGNER